LIARIGIKKVKREKSHVLTIRIIGDIMIKHATWHAEQLAMLSHNLTVLSQHSIRIFDENTAGGEN